MPPNLVLPPHDVVAPAGAAGKPMVERTQADKFCDSHCTAIDHHADCEYGNPSY